MDIVGEDPERCKGRRGETGSEKRAQCAGWVVVEEVERLRE
jgi:hypothetical protein